jgi:hypothetical protein
MRKEVWIVAIVLIVALGLWFVAPDDVLLSRFDGTINMPAGGGGGPVVIDPGKPDVVQEIGELQRMGCYPKCDCQEECVYDCPPAPSGAGGHCDQKMWYCIPEGNCEVIASMMTAQGFPKYWFNAPCCGGRCYDISGVDGQFGTWDDKDCCGSKEYVPAGKIEAQSCDDERCCGVKTYKPAGDDCVYTDLDSPPDYNGSVDDKKCCPNTPEPGESRVRGIFGCCFIDIVVRDEGGAAFVGDNPWTGQQGCVLYISGNLSRVLGLKDGDRKPFTWFDDFYDKWNGNVNNPHQAVLLHEIEHMKQWNDGSHISDLYPQNELEAWGTEKGNLDDLKELLEGPICNPWPDQSTCTIDYNVPADCCLVAKKHHLVTHVKNFLECVLNNQPINANTCQTCKASHLDGKLTSEEASNVCGEYCKDKVTDPSPGGC